jgi:hypothetical protein
VGGCRTKECKEEGEQEGSETYGWNDGTGHGMAARWLGNTCNIYENILNRVNIRGNTCEEWKFERDKGARADSFYDDLAVQLVLGLVSVSLGKRDTDHVPTKCVLLRSRTDKF